MVAVVERITMNGCQSHRTYGVVVVESSARIERVESSACAYVFFIDVVPRDFEGFDAHHVSRVEARSGALLHFLKKSDFAYLL